MRIGLVRISALLFILTFIQNGAIAAERVVSLEEAYRAARANSERIGIAKEALTQAEKEKERAKSFLYPKLTADLTYLRRPKEISSFFGVLLPEREEQLNLVLEQPLYVGGRASATYRIAKMEIRGERLGLELATEGLLFDVAQTYYEALKAGKNVLIEEAEVERLEAHRRDAEKRFRVGESTRSALLRAEAELSNANAKLIRAKNQKTVMIDQLSMLAGIPGPFDLADPPFVTIAEQPEEEWIRAAHERHPDLQRRLLGIEIARERVDYAKGAFYPSLSFEGRYSRLNQDPDSPFLVREDKTAMLKLTFPIFEGTLRVAELSQARSRMRQAGLQASLLKDEISLQVRRALLNLTSLTSELDHLKRRVVFAKDAFSLNSRQFAVGLGTQIDVLDASAALMDAERQLSNTTYDREVAILDLQRAVGIFLSSIQQNESSPQAVGGEE
ncbi:MAG TPA: TolC family protein [Candidatus Manganitrophaceae bacterium]|nr:TolC family protein [Candidatus Manganitrophaceae bacterium]